MWFERSTICISWDLLWLNCQSSSGWLNGDGIICYIWIYYDYNYVWAVDEDYYDAVTYCDYNFVTCGTGVIRGVAVAEGTAEAFAETV